MDDKRGSRQDQAIPMLGILVVVAGSLGYFFLQKPLQSFRPAVEAPPKPPLERKLPARLWQDPLREAREAFVNAKPGETPQGQVDRLPSEAGDTILVVQGYGGYSQLDHETRLRTRFAVGLALEHAGYVPDGEDSEFLRFVAVELSMDPHAPERKTTKLIPFEQWNPTPRRSAGCITETAPRLFVLWVGDDVTPERQLRSTMSLVEAISKTPPPRPLRVIGPTSSGGLRAMITEWDREQDPELFRVFSPWATADNAFLLKSGQGGWPPEIVRTIESDRVVAGRLLNELQIRNIDLMGNDKVTLLAEYDTEYGRSLPETFAACLNLRREQGLDCARLSPNQEELFRNAVLDLQKNSDRWPRQVERAIYLRGLDGVGPRSGPGKPNEADLKEQVNLDLSVLERPDGSGQLDYARRLADEITKPNGGRLRAVGVLGSDIYDKLLLLQALSGRLRGAWFFTTDLDASYLHASQNMWTRNLLVGSSFPLHVDPRQWWQGPGSQAMGIKISAPFRDCYGAAIFISTLQAVKPFSCLVQKLDLEKQVPVAVYEIGARNAHRMPIPGEPHRIAGVRPMWGLWLWGILAAILLPLLHTLLTGNPAMRAVTCFAVVSLLFQLLFLSSGADEPLEWFDGISIWPSEICRAASGALAILFLVWSRESLRESRDSIARDFGYELKPERPRPGSRSWFVRMWKLVTEPWGRAETLETIWDRYDEQGRPAYRYFRAGVLTLITAGVLWVAETIENPFRPCRGDSCFADTVIGAFSILTQLLLIYVVLDVTLACSRWIRTLQYFRTLETAPDCGGMPCASIEMEQIARRTQAVSHLVLYPFLTLPLLIISQFDFFDRWDWPISLVTIYVLLLVLALTSAVILRRSAESARSRAAEEVRTLRRRALEAGEDEKAQKLSAVLEEIQMESRGAFSSLSQNPVLAAILIPLGGAGAGLGLDALIGML